MALCVFRGGFTLRAATQVADADLASLVSLADKSFIQVGGTDRYDIHELLRQYASERLDSSGLTD